MNFKTQKKLAAQIFKCSPSKVKLDVSRGEEIKESITKVDIKNLIADEAIVKKKVNGPSRARARKIASQKSKGRRKGPGSRKGKKTARLNPKTDWINRIRKQRVFLKDLKDKEIITKEDYRKLYRKSSGGFFRSVRHIKLYVTDLIKKKN